MAKVYLMLEDLPTERDTDVSLGWAVDWGGEAPGRPEVLTDAQETVDRFLDVLERIPWAQRGTVEEGRIILLPGTVA